MLMLKDGNVSCTQPESGDICLAVVYSYVALNRYLPVIVFMFVKVFNTGRETIRELYNYDLTIGLKASTSCFVNIFVMFILTVNSMMNLFGIRIHSSLTEVKVLA